MSSCSSTPRNLTDMGRLAGPNWRRMLQGSRWEYDSGQHAIYRKGEFPVSAFSDKELFRYFLGARTLWAFCDASRKPHALFLENQRGCQLRCTYCYAETGDDSKAHHKVDPNYIRDLAQRYKFQSLNIYGGDFFYDWKLGQECLEAIGPVENLTISTNGIGVTPERIAFLKKFGRNLLLQYSIEPTRWGSRASGNGKHQNDILKENLHAVSAAFPQLTFSVSVVVPSNVTPETIGSLCGNIDEFRALLGTDRFFVAYKGVSLPGEAGDTVLGKPEVWPWAAKLLAEEWDLISSGQYTYQLSRQGMLGGVLGQYRLAAAPYNKHRPFSFMSCAAGLGAISVGPDNKLYACHEEAINMLPGKEFASETPRGTWGRINPTMAQMDNQVCAGCPSKWFCGGICYVMHSNTVCEMQRARQALSLHAAEAVCEDTLEALAKAQDDWRVSLDAQVADVRPLLASPEWGKLIRGELPPEEMVGLAHSLNGVRVNLDAPLWEQEPLPPDAIRDNVESYAMRA